MRFRGSEKNVIERFYLAAKKYDYQNIVRITGDCPLIDHEIVDRVISKFLTNKVDYCSNTQPPTWPDGLDVEIFSFNALERSFNSNLSNYDKEHVTPFIRNNSEFISLLLRQYFPQRQLLINCLFYSYQTL